MSNISYENLLVNRIQATKIRGRMSLKEYCLIEIKVRGVKSTYTYQA